MRRSSLITISLALSVTADQLDIPSLQQPLQPARSVNDNSNLFEVSDLPISDSGLQSVRPDIDVSAIIDRMDSENHNNNNDKLVQEIQIGHQDLVEPSLDHMTEPKDLPTEAQRQQHEDGEPSIHSHQVHHTHHHTHGHHRYKHNRRHRLNHNPRKQYGRNTMDNSATGSTVTQTRTLVRTDSEESSLTTALAGVLADPKSNFDSSDGTDDHLSVKTEDDLINLNTQIDLNLDLSAIGGSWHESALEGGSSNTRYRLEKTVKNMLDSTEDHPQTSGSSGLYAVYALGRGINVLLIGAGFGTALGFIL